MSKSTTNRRPSGRRTHTLGRCAGNAPRRAGRDAKLLGVEQEPGAPVLTRLFVCDTRMAGERHHEELGTARRVVADVRTKPVFRLLDRGGLTQLAADGNTAVRGEIYEVDASMLEELDRGFGHPRFFERTSIDLEDGSRADAYLTPQRCCSSDDAVHESGDWRAHEEAWGTWAVRAGEREIIGTPLEIVRALQDLAFGIDGFSMRQYIDWVVTNAREHLGIELSVRGETEEEVAESYLKALLRAGLVQRC